MNTLILQQYHLSFQIEMLTNGLRIPQVRSTSNTNILSGLLADYFLDSSVVGFKENILSEINTAVNNQPFDPKNDGLHEFVSITIGATTSYIKNDSNTNLVEAIPTLDLKEIILTWIEWVETNNLDG